MRAAASYARWLKSCPEDDVSAVNPAQGTPATAPATRLNGSRILTIRKPSSVTRWYGSASFRNAPLGIASSPIPLENLSGLGKKARCGAPAAVALPNETCILVRTPGGGSIFCTINVDIPD
jgi:hypothetical protein